jgi:hypothetical protein
MVIPSDRRSASNTDHRQPITDYSLVLGLGVSSPSCFSAADQFLLFQGGQLDEARVQPGDTNHQIAVGFRMPLRRA